MSDSSSDGGSQRGRPKKDPENRRTVSHGLYLSEKEKRELERRADAAGLSVNEYLRRKALGGKPVRASADEDLRAELGTIGNNLNQLTRRAHQDGAGRVAEAAEETLRELKKALRNLQS